MAELVTLIPKRGVSTPLASEGQTVIANTNPQEPMETNGTPGESSGSLPAARTEPREVEETPGRRSGSPQEAEEIILPPLEPVDPVDALGGASAHSRLGARTLKAGRKQNTKAQALVNTKINVETRPDNVEEKRNPKQ